MRMRLPFLMNLLRCRACVRYRESAGGIKKADYEKGYSYYFFYTVSYIYPELFMEQIFS